MSFSNYENIFETFSALKLFIHVFSLQTQAHTRITCSTPSTLPKMDPSNSRCHFSLFIHCSSPPLFLLLLFLFVCQQGFMIVSAMINHSSLFLSLCQDFVTALSILLRGTTTEKLEWTFNLYDINRDGYINKEVCVCQKIYPVMSYIQ